MAKLVDANILLRGGIVQKVMASKEVLVMDNWPAGTSLVVGVYKDTSTEGKWPWNVFEWKTGTYISAEKTRAGAVKKAAEQLSRAGRPITLRAILHTIKNCGVQNSLSQKGESST